MTQKNYKISLINQLMLDGNKWKSELILLKNFKKIQKIQKIQTNFILKFAVINNSPYFNVKQVKKKKKKIEFPFLLTNNVRIYQSIRNIITNKKNKKLYLELLDLSNNQGTNVNLKKTIHKESFLKKKLSNYRWF